MTLITHGALTNSKRRSCFTENYPDLFTKCEGAYAFSGANRYIDYICGLGSCLLGHAQPRLVEAIHKQSLNGLTYSLGSQLELELAKELNVTFPVLQSMRFLKTGSEACAAAIRIARAYNGKNKVMSQGYHGWADDFISLTPPAFGVPKRDFIIPLPNDISSRNGAEMDLSAIIVEPIMTDASQERVNWLIELREWCTKYNVVLIYDEIITGFRWQKFCVANQTGIQPDLLCLGKAIAGGMPLSVVGGKKEIMETPNEWFVSSTFAGEQLSIACALETIKMLKTTHRIDDLWASGKYFLERFNIYDDTIQIKGYPTRGVFEGDDRKIAMFWQEAVKAGLLFGKSWFLNFESAKLTEQVLSVCEDIFFRINNGYVELAGPLPAKPFAQAMREKL